MKQRKAIKLVIFFTLISLITLLLSFTFIPSKANNSSDCSFVENLFGIKSFMPSSTYLEIDYPQKKIIMENKSNKCITLELFKPFPSWSCQFINYSGINFIPGSNINVKNSTISIDIHNNTFINTQKSITLQNSLLSPVCPNSQLSTTYSEVFITINHVTYKITKNNEVQLYRSISNEKKMSIPSYFEYNGKKYSVTSISDKAFKNNKHLVEIKIPSSVKSLGIKSFKGCKKLKVIQLNANNISYIGKDAFKGIKRTATFKIVARTQKKYKSLIKKILQNSNSKKYKFKIKKK